MTITIKLFTMLRMAFGVPSVTVQTDTEVITMGELVELAAQQLGPKLKQKLYDGPHIRKGAILMVDGRNVVHMQGLATPIRQENEICFFPPGGGG